MTGLILCGGQSSRMGTDKGLLQLEAKTWAQAAADKMALLGVPVYFSVNKTQYTDYAAALPHDRLIVDDDQLHIKGPLAGMLSAHRQFPQEDIFVLACDMPLMDETVLRQLEQAFYAHPVYDAWLFSNNGQPEPLCAIFKSASLAGTVALYGQGQLERFSLKYVLDRIHAFVIPLREDQQKYFKNFNVNADLSGL